ASEVNSDAAACCLLLLSTAPAVCLLPLPPGLSGAGRGQEAGQQDGAGREREEAPARGEQQRREREDVVEGARRALGGLAEGDGEGQQPRAHDGAKQTREESDPYLPHVFGTSLIARPLFAARSRRARVDDQAQVLRPTLEAFERAVVHD